MTGSGMGRLRRLVGLELFKLKLRRMTWTLLATSSALAVVFPWLFFLGVKLGESGDKVSSTDRSVFSDRIGFPGALQGALDTTLSVGLPLLIILVASSFGGEFAWGTLRLAIARGEGRREFVASKLVALGWCWAVGLILSVAVGLMSSSVVAVVAGEPGPSDVSGHDLLRFAGHSAAALLGGWVYVGVTAFSTLRRQSTAIGLSAGLLLFFGDRVTSAAAIATSIGPLEFIGKAGINYNLRTLTGGAGEAPNPLPIALLAITAYLVAFIVGSTRLLLTKDITISGVG